MFYSRVSRMVCACTVTSIAVLPLLMSGCHSSVQKRKLVDQSPVAPVAVVSRAPLTNTLHVAGVFSAAQVVELHAKVAGYIRSINVDIGDKVKAGQVLATLDTPELAAQVLGADAGVAQTQEQIARARSEVIRAEANRDALHAAAQRLQQAFDTKPGLIAQQELDDALARDRAASAQVDAAKAALSATQQQLGVSRADKQRYSAVAGYSRITAPFSGVVTWRYADTGALIQAGTSNSSSTPVVKIAQVSTLRLRLPVPEALASFVRVGDAAQIRVQSLGLTFSGKISRKTYALDPATRTEQVEIDVPNPDNKLAPGMYADVTLPVQRTGDSLVVPVQAVDTTGEEPVVLVVNSANKVEKRTVTVGLTTADHIEIASSLKDGEKVIVANLATFHPGEEVKPVPAAMGVPSAKNDEGGDD
ncbi:MAG: efflux RND transporter periplasmic adaptor subunit [Acidobacteria bacterium]|nr:efflux RND transporter periplasmic adaptor subunit [Acidobacteriota bacterium]